MNNISFLKKLLTSNARYWIVARHEYINQYGERTRQPDSIWFIMIPDKFEVSMIPDEILVKDLEELYYSHIDNISISDNFTPFQRHLSLSDFYTGYPIHDNHKDILTRALLMAGDTNIHAYENLIKISTQPIETEQQNKP